MHRTNYPVDVAANDCATEMGDRGRRSTDDTLRSHRKLRTSIRALLLSDGLIVDSASRAAGGGSVLRWLRSCQRGAWEFIVKLDGDLTFEPDYFEACFAQFSDDPRLGIGGGTILVRTTGG